MEYNTKSIKCAAAEAFLQYSSNAYKKKTKTCATLRPRLKDDVMQSNELISTCVEYNPTESCGICYVPLEEAQVLSACCRHPQKQMCITMSSLYLHGNLPVRTNRRDNSGTEEHCI